MPRKAELLPEATLLPGVRSAQVTANSGRMTSRQGAVDGQGRREDAGEARGSCRRPLERTRGVEKGKQPQTCFIARTESGAGGVWPCPAGRRRTRPLRGRRDQARSEDARLAHLSAELQETGTVSAKRKSTAGALKLSKCGMRSAPLNILSEWGRRGAMRGDGGWGATSGYRIEAKSETRGYAGGRNRDNLGRKHGQGHARRKRFQSLRLEVGRGGED